MDSSPLTSPENPTANAQLFEAAKKGNIFAIQRALNNKAKINSVDGDGYTALMHAVMHLHTNTARVLLDLSTESALTIQNELGDVFWKEGGVTWSAKPISPVDQTPLVATNEKKRSVLGIAAASGHTAILPELIARVGRQALNEPEGAFDSTPLMLAASNGHLKTVQAFLRAGANPYLKNILGHTAFEIALVANYNEVAACLWNAMKIKQINSFELQDKIRKFLASTPAKSMIFSTAGNLHAMTTRSKAKAKTLQQAYRADTDPHATSVQPLSKKMRRK